MGFSVKKGSKKGSENGPKKGVDFGQKRGQKWTLFGPLPGLTRPGQTGQAGSAPLESTVRIGPFDP